MNKSMQEVLRSGRSSQSNPPGPPSKNEPHNEKNTDLSHKYVVQPHLR